MKSGISITIRVFLEYWLKNLLPEAGASLYPFQVDPESGHVTYEIRHAAVEEGQLGLPQDFEGATFKLTTGAAFKDNNGWLTGADSKLYLSTNFWEIDLLIYFSLAVDKSYSKEHWSISVHELKCLTKSSLVKVLNVRAAINTWNKVSKAKTKHKFY